MPTYVYKFLDTNETIEVQQAFTDDALTEAVHPVTGAVLPVKKVFLPVGVTFKGGGPAAQAVAGGHVAVVASSLAVAKAQAEGKLVKNLFVTSKKRTPTLPDVPALPELGYKFADVDLEFWWGLFVPKGVPEPIRAKLEKALQTAMATPAVRERLIKVGTDPSFAPGAAIPTSARDFPCFSQMPGSSRRLP